MQLQRDGHDWVTKHACIICTTNLILKTINVVNTTIYPYFEEVKWTLLSHVQLFVTQWTIEAVEFSRPEYWSG